MTAYQLCPACRTRRPPEWFLTTWGKPRQFCRLCARKEADYTASRLRQHIANGEKRCSRCLEWKPIAQFPKDGTRVQARCRDCKNGTQCMNRRSLDKGTSLECPDCHGILKPLTDENGVLFESCRCGYKPVVIRRPKNFQRYEATAE